MTPTEFGQFDFSSPDIPGESTSSAPAAPQFDFSSPDAPDGGSASPFSFETLIGQLKPITSKPSDSFNWFMGQAAQTGRRVGYLYEQGAHYAGEAAKNLLPGSFGDEAIDTLYGAQEAGGQMLQNRSKESSQYWLDNVSEDFKKKANAGLDDPEFGVTTLYAAALGSMPEMMLTMGSGAIAGKLTQMASTVGYARIAAAAEAGSPLASKMLSYSKYAPAIGGAIAGGATEGSLAAGATGVAMEERVNAMSHEELIESSDRYRDVYESAFGMADDERRAYAKRTVAEELGRTTAAWVGLSTAALGAPTGALMGYLGGRAAGAVGMGQMARKLEGSVTGQAATGFAAEGAQEFLQEGSQQFLQNLGIREYADNKQGLGEGVLDNAVIGGLVGGMMGGVMTPAVGGAARAQARGETAAEEATAKTEEIKYSRNPLLEAKIIEQIKGMEAANVDPVEFQKVARWAGQTAAGGRSAIEFSKALEDLTESGVAPDYVNAMVGEDYTMDGMLSQRAYEKDAQRLDFAVEMRIKPADEMEQAAVMEALAKDGANPYELDDGTLVVPQSEPGRGGLQAVAKSIQKKLPGINVEIVSREASQDAEGAGTEVAQNAEGAEGAVAAKAEDVLTAPDAEIPGDVDESMKPMYSMAAGAKPVFDAVIENAASAVGGSAIIAPLKGGARALEKVASDYAGDASKIKDIVRATIEVDSVEDAKDALAAIEQRFDVLPTGRRDTLTGEPGPDGYRDIKVNVDLGDGLVGEVQVNLKGMTAVKLAEHVKYERIQEIHRDARDRDLTPEEESEISQLQESMRATYSSAFSNLASKPGNRVSNSSRVTEAPLRFAETQSKRRGLSESSAQSPTPEPATRRDSTTGTPSTSQNRSEIIETPPLDEETVAQVDAPRKNVAVTEQAHLEEMGRTAASHPESGRPEPTERQLRAGNYPKGHGTLKGEVTHEDVPVSIENVPGSIRRGLDGKWSRKMKHWYGYIRGTKHLGDGKLDVYMGKNAHDNKLPVFVIHQNNTDGTFDEPKVVMGYKTEGEAKEAYLSEYPANLGPKLYGGISRLSRAQFADYIDSGHTDVPPNPITKQPMRDMKAQFSVASGTTDKPATILDFYQNPKRAFTAPGWAVITATRESAGDANSIANLEANRDLEKNLYNRGIKFMPVKGSYQGVDQGKNYLIQANERTAIELGAFYGQESILTNRGLVYMDGRLTPAVHEKDIVGRKALKEEFYSELPNGTAFSLGLDFDATAADPKPRNVDEETASVSYKKKKPIEARAREEETRPRAEGLLSLNKPEPSSVAQAKTTFDDAVKIVGRTVANLKGAPEVSVVNESDLPDHLRDQIIDHGAQGLIEGVYDPYEAKVYIIPKNVRMREGEDFSAAVERIMAEETMGHFGLFAVFGDKQRNRLLDEVWRDAKATPRMKSIIKGYGDVYGDITDADVQRRMANEYLSKLDPGDRPTLWQKAVAWLREALRNAGFVREWNDNDLKVLMERVFDSVRTGHVPDSLKKLNRYTLMQDGAEGVTSRFKDRTVEYDGDTRRIRTPKYRASLQDGMEGGLPAADVHSFSGDLKELARYVGEEGKHVIVAPTSVITAADIARTEFEYSLDEGAHVIKIPAEMIRAESKETAALFSLRNRERGSDDVEAILAKTVQEHTHEMSWGQRMNQWFREMTGYFGSGDTWAELKTGWIDSAQAIEKLERNKFGGKLLDAAESPYKMVTLTKNLPQVMGAIAKVGVPQFKDGSFVPVQGRKGMYEIFGPLFRTDNGKNLLHLWEGYAVARRSAQLIDQTNPDGTSKEKLLTRQEIDTLLALERQYPVFRKVFDDWQEFNKQVLDLAVDRGAMSKEEADLWKQNDYVPFFRVEEEGEEQVAGITRKRGLSGQKVTSKRLTGSDKRIQPVLENIMLNTASIIEKVYKNEAMNRIVALAEGSVLEKIPMRAEAIKFTNEDIARALHKAGLFVGDDTNSTPEQRKAGKLLRNNDIDYAVRAVESMTPEQREAWTTLFRRVRPEGKDVVSVLVAGKPVYYRVHDPLVLRGIMDMTPVNFGALVDFMGGAKKLLTNMVTLDPGFMFANWLRDTLSTWVVSDESIHPFIEAPQHAAEVWTESGLMTELAMAGGMTGGFYNPTEDFADVMNQVADPGTTVLNSPKKLVEAYRRIGMVSEQVNRLAVAKAVLRRGGSISEAAYQAQDVLNFSQSGDAVAAQLLIRTVPFLNARIQGLYRLWKGARGLDRDPSMHKLSFVFKGLLLAGISMALAMKNLGDERYEKLPDFQKDTYWHFFVGDHHYAIPKPFEVGVLFSTLPERALRLATGHDTGRTVAHSVTRAVGDTFAFNPIPQLFKPVVEQWANRSFFTGRPIVGMELEDLEPQAQYNPWTSETARAITAGIDAVIPDSMQRMTPETLRSPTRLEYAMRAYLGTIGAYILQLSDASLRAAGVFPSAPSMETVRDIPVLGQAAGRFVRGDPELESGNKYTDDLYDALKAADSAYKTLGKYTTDANVEAASELVDRRIDALSVRPILRDFKEAMSNLNTQQRFIMQSDMDPEDKRAALDEITRQKNEIARQAVPYLSMMNY